MDVEKIPFMLAFAAGAASFLSPCHLAIVPAYLAFLNGSAAQSGAPSRRRELVVGAVLFALGFGLAMVALGTSVGLVGYALLDQIPWLRKAGGVILMVLGLHVVGLLRLPMLYRQARIDVLGPRARTPWDGLILGAVLGVGWTPCIGPVLAGILVVAAERSTVWEGAVLLATYAAGLGLPFVAVAALIGRIPTLVQRLRPSARLAELSSGAMLVIMGGVLYTNQLQRMAAFLGAWAPL
ncbi:MAG: cytochrome c biogenesis CcdA family protein [Chloroflexota bacterium]